MRTISRLVSSSMLVRGVVILLAGSIPVLAQDKAKGSKARSTPSQVRARAKGGGLTSSVPVGKWLGQDGHDHVGPASVVAPSDVQDIHIALGGLPRDGVIVLAKVSALGGGEWFYKGPHGPWAAQILREAGSPHAELFVEPGQVENGRPFQVVLQFEDGRKLEINVPGGKADPNLRAEGAAMTAKWAGQEREDRVGTGPSVGPDGVVDAKITLSRLSRTIEITSVVIAGSGGQQWHTGVNPKGHPSAEVFRRGEDPTTADVFLGFPGDPKGQTLTISVSYNNGKSDQAKVVAGRYDPKQKSARGAAPSLVALPLTSHWFGQDDTNQVGPGDVHVGLKGLPRLGIVAAALNNGSNGLWMVKFQENRPFDAGAYSLPMSLKRAADPSLADLHFPPLRDETGGVMTLRILFEDGRMAVSQFPGGKADPGLRASFWPAKTTVNARPGDDLNDLARRFGTIQLSAGRYVMKAPLVLEKPVHLVGQAGSTLEFVQDAGAPTWTSAIKIHSGHTTLEGFAVRFASPIRWTPGIDGGAAVIGLTDNHDPSPGDFKTDINLRKLDIEGPPATSPWEEAPRLMRLARAVSGSIVGNTLKGGAIDLENGPWRVENNTYLGTQPNTFAFSVISIRHAHDLIVRGNTARPVAGTGKTWRFLVMTGSGHDDLIEENIVANIGPKDGDSAPNQNAPEIVLTEAYSLHFEGKPSAVSPDGRVLVVPRLQGEPARTGAVVAILTGPEAGQWRKILQAMGPTAYLLDSPLPEGEPVISIATGFVGETFRKNTIDARGGSVAANLVLAGNHFGLTVAENHLIGGGDTFRIVAAASESPVHWGWSHAPLLGATIENNVIEDSLRGGTLCVEHSTNVKSQRGRVYGSATLKGNIYRWTEKGSAASRHAVRIGDPGFLDPDELVVTHSKESVEGPSAAVLHVVGARVNGKSVVGKDLPLSRSPGSTAGNPVSKPRR